MISRSHILDFITTNSFMGRQKSFNFDKQGLQQYINWSFCNDFMLLFSNGKEITSTLVVYPLPSVPKKINDMLPHNGKTEGENIAIMDFIAKDKESRIQITKEFMKKYPNWKSQRKWAIRNGKLAELSNKHIEFMGGQI